MEKKWWTRLGLMTPVNNTKIDLHSLSVIRENLKLQPKSINLKPEAVPKYST